MSSSGIAGRCARLTRDVLLPRQGRHRWAGVCGVLGLVSAVAVGLVGFLPAVASNAVAGRRADARTAQAIMVSAFSCPVLTGPRLAGVMMAESGMDFNATGGAAGLPSDTFAKWAPWQQASIYDPDANIYALAHYLCDLAGKVRQAGIRGDQWADVLAAHHSGLAAVQQAGGVPAEAQSYVATVNGYAGWYATQPGFALAENNTVKASAAPEAVTDHLAPLTDTKPVPDAYVDSVVAAGSVCSAVTPAMVAAQLMASSGFNPNLLAGSQAMGVAQFLPDLWMRYAPSARSSPWDPDTAIRLLGQTMCDLIRQFSRISGKPYQLALAAFRVGPTAVRQAGGMPPLALVQQFVSQVEADTSAYAKDTRLTAAASRSQAPSSPTASTTSSPRPSSPTTPAVPSNHPTLSTKATNPGDVFYTGILRSWATGACLQGNDTGRVWTEPCVRPVGSDPHQNWKITIFYWADGDSPFVQIQNVATGMFLHHGAFEQPVYQSRESAPLPRTGQILTNWYTKSTWQMFPVGDLLHMRFDAAIHTNHCLDANYPSNVVLGARPYVHTCGSSFQDWHLGY